ncbi:hypothetical protein CK203_003551 [Vitis vinifera]|uniref:Uncharacterized protein n=1 Tax=Vitis vinifera TaxID=29760 RepID=A0A438K8H4_VITVI|nr:hypothetical protein CK203_003551 [Vitis vinifera]
MSTLTGMFACRSLGWALYYAGTTSVAFGSSYYHLKPDDNRVIWINCRSRKCSGKSSLNTQYAPIECMLQQ